MSLIAMIDDREIEPAARAQVQGFSRTTGDIDNIYKLLMIHKPLFAAWCSFGGALFNATLPFRDREIAVLRVLCNARDDYDWTHHVGICQEHETLSDAEVKSIAGVTPFAAAGLSQHDILILQTVDEIMTTHRIGRGNLESLKTTYSDIQVIELTQLCGFYLGIAFTNNSAELPLEPQFVSLKTW
jgi:Carboxymuconolactone decarboxylase family